MIEFPDVVFAESTGSFEEGIKFTLDCCAYELIHMNVKHANKAVTRSIKLPEHSEIILFPLFKVALGFGFLKAFGLESL